LTLERGKNRDTSPDYSYPKAVDEPEMRDPHRAVPQAVAGKGLRGTVSGSGGKSGSESERSDLADQHCVEWVGQSH